MMQIALTGRVRKIVDIGELSYDEMGDLKRMVDSEVIRRVMAKVEQNAMAKAERKER